MTQSAIIAACLLAGFVLFLAARGRLGIYAAVLWGNTTSPLPNYSPSSSSPSNSSSASLNTAAQVASTAASFL